MRRVGTDPLLLRAVRVGVCPRALHTPAWDDRRALERDVIGAAERERLGDRHGPVSDVTRPQVTAGFAALKRTALASGRMHEPITVEASTSRRAARVLVPLTDRAPTLPPTARWTRCAAK